MTEPKKRWQATRHVATVTQQNRNRTGSSQSRPPGFTVRLALGFYCFCLSLGFLRSDIKHDVAVYYAGLQRRYGPFCARVRPHFVLKVLQGRKRILEGWGGGEGPRELLSGRRPLVNCRLGNRVVNLMKWRVEV